VSLVNRMVHRFLSPAAACIVNQSQWTTSVEYPLAPLDKENEIREMELQRQRAKDDVERKRRVSMEGQTRFYGCIKTFSP